MTFEQLQEQRQLLLLECVSGSRAYNLQIPSSDRDLKGIFILPQEELYGMHYTDIVSNASSDEVYFEIGRFLELLEKNNPNILELLSTSGENCLLKHPLMERIRPAEFLSKLCLDTFAGYARTQIKKARGLNKKINQSFDEVRKELIEFCYVIRGGQSRPLRAWLHENSLLQQDCGLTHIPHFRDVYALYHRGQFAAGALLKGIYSGPEANEVQLSQVSAGVEPAAIMQFNKDGYTKYCREFAAYWQWTTLRNEARYEHNRQLGADYDTKHMMHTFRLLTMAEEVALHQEVRVYREDREFLLRIRNGDFTYDALLQLAADKLEKMEWLYAASSLPERPSPELANRLLVSIRKDFYHEKK